MVSIRKDSRFQFLHELNFLCFQIKVCKIYVKYAKLLHTTSQVVENGAELIHCGRRVNSQLRPLCMYILRCALGEVYLIVCYPKMKIVFQIVQLYSELCIQWVDNHNF